MKKKHLIGRLAIKNRAIFFEYSSSFLQTKTELSPFKLPLKPGLIHCEDKMFDGLFGVFNDSLPDGWGRLLLDRKLMQLGINFRDLSPLDRLCYVGNNGMGALTYEPETEVAMTYPDKALAIIEEVQSAVSRWENYAKDYHVGAASRKMIADALNRTEKMLYS